MRLKELLQGLSYEVLQGSLETEVTGLALHSQQVEKGHLFGAVVGTQLDGHQFIGQALRGGAVAILGQKESPPLPLEATYIRVADSRQSMAHVAEAFYGRPSAQIGLIGITGTNGKTTTLHLLKAILEKASLKPSTIGTISYDVGGQSIEAHNTTPSCVELSRLFHKAVQAGHQWLIMEVSSHSLEQKRVEALAFDMAIFTNITHDHLDYHPSFDHYLQAKRRLFQLLSRNEQKKGTAMVNRDDPHASSIIKATRGQVITYGLRNKAHYRAANWSLSLRGSSFEVLTPEEKARVSLSLPGLHNIYNSLSALATAGAMGIDLRTAIEAIEGVHEVPGRLEAIEQGQPFDVFVDYAHSPDGLRAILESVKPLCQGRLIVVFGCGGNRDQLKRPIMGAVAAKWSDFVIVTSDNPRKESPSQIASEIEKGLKESSKIRGDDYVIILDRYEAIQKALSMAQSQDVVIIAGKGHENYQIFEDRVIPFDDREAARQVLRQMMACSR